MITDATKATLYLRGSACGRGTKNPCYFVFCLKKWVTKLTVQPMFHFFGFIYVKFKNEISSFLKITLLENFAFIFNFSSVG